MEITESSILLPKHGLETARNVQSSLKEKTFQLLSNDDRRIDDKLGL